MTTNTQPEPTPRHAINDERGLLGLQLRRQWVAIRLDGEEAAWSGDKSNV